MVWKYAGRYVLPFSPSNMKMDIRWNTALADTISSVRTRSLSKEYPQFTVKYSTLLKGAGLQFATDRVLRDLDQEVLVPMWQDVATERISDTEVALSSTDKTFYKVGSQVLLWASDTEWQIVDVTVVNATSVEFGVNSTDWKCVAPIEEGFMAASPSTSTDRNRNTKLDYSVVIKRLDGPLSTTGGGVIPGYYVDSFIGNGVDSGVVSQPLTSIPTFIGIHCKFNFLSTESGNRTLQSFGSVAGRPLGQLYTRLGTEVAFYTYTSNVVRAWTTGSVLTLGESYSIQIGYTIGNSPTLFINGLIVPMSLFYSPVGGAPQVLPIQNMIGTNFARNQPCSNEIYDSYWSTNPDFILPSSVAQYAEAPNPQEDNRPYYTGKELFTQVAPDALPSAWLGGAVQGTIEISPPSGSPVTPYPEDPKLTRTPIQSTKANNYSLHLNTVKSVGGVIKVNSMRSVPTVTTTHTWDNQNRSEYLDMLDFAARCRGRKNAFDTASFKCDLIPITEGAIGNGYLDVLDPGLQSLTLQGTRFTVIRGSSWDSSEVYEILSLENVTGGVRLILDKAIAVTIFTTDAVSNIRQSRLNSDVLEINIDSFTKSSASVSVRDINEGG